MEIFLTVCFMAALIALGASYFKACRDMAKDLISSFDGRKNIESEGGDNWPNINVEVGSFESSDNTTYADIETGVTSNKSNKQKHCVS